MRELIYSFESTKQSWAKQLKDLLAKMERRRNELIATGISEYPASELEEYLTRYDNLISEGIEKNPIPKKFLGQRGTAAKGKTRCLLERMRDYKSDILRFATYWDVPFTNNEAERTIRFAKVKQKISGCFRTVDGAEVFALIMSYLSTARKHCVNVYDAFLAALDGNACALVKSWD